MKQAIGGAVALAVIAVVLGLLARDNEGLSGSAEGAGLAAVILGIVALVMATGPKRD